LCPALQDVSVPPGSRTTYAIVAKRPSMERRQSASLTRVIVAAGPSFAWVVRIPCTIAARIAAGGPLPATSPSANPMRPEVKSKYSKKSPPMVRHGSDAPAAS